MSSGNSNIGQIDVGLTTMPRLLFLDEDHILGTLRTLLSSNGEHPSLRPFFAPEEVDFKPLLAEATGLRCIDGAVIGQGELPDADVIVFRRATVDSSVMDRHPRLKLIQRLGERSEGIDLNAASARGIRVSCAQRVTLHYTAEHAMLLMLALGKQLLVADRAVREGRPDAPKPQKDGTHNNWVSLLSTTGLHGRTLGIVGMGEAGVLVAKLAKAFGMNVLYTNRRRATPATELASGARFAPLQDLLLVADYVSLHAAGTPENRGMANAAFFAAMRPDAYFVNTSRGRLVDEDALYDVLKSGRIAGAALDVHAFEPRPAQDRFAGLSNVILTPHIGPGLKSEVLKELSVIIRNCRAALRGEDLQYELKA